jgi:hypothetical protein
MASTTVIHYEVRPDAASENERLIRDVFEELATARPTGFRYAAARLADGVTFVHVITGDRARAGEELRRLVAFQAFSRNAKKRWADGTGLGESTVIGTFDG